MPRYSLRLLDALGLAPPLDRCVRCTLELTLPCWLDAPAGGLICGACRERWRELPEIGAEDLACLRALAAPKGGGAGMRANAHIGAAVDALIAHHLGRRPRAGAPAAELAGGRP